MTTPCMGGWCTKRQKCQNYTEADRSDPDAALICCKQRHGEWEGGINLWFDRDSQQYVEQPGIDPVRYSVRMREAV